MDTIGQSHNQPTPRISAVINTLNEEHNLPYALRSVRPWVDEIVVVDMHSEDRTVEIAREYGSKVYLHPKIPAFDGARAFAVAQATGDWILMLDADELIPKVLSETLIRIAQEDTTDVVAIPMVNYMLGAPMMHTRTDPSTTRHARFFKRNSLQLTDNIHKYSHVAATSRVLRLPYERGKAMVHFASLDSAHILDKINRYTTIEAEQYPTLGKNPSALRAAAKASKTFFYHYVSGMGYRDGWRGLYVSVASALYVLVIEGKLFELQTNGPREAVRYAYQREAEKLIMEYTVSCTSSASLDAAAGGDG